MRRIGFGLRVLALAIDVVLILCASIVVLVAIEPSETGVDMIVMGGWLVYTTTELAIACTPGKLVLGLRIANADGTAADFWALFLRWSTKQLPMIAQLLFLCTSFVAFRLLSGFSSLVVLVGCLYAMNESRQTWHDEWARTAVFRRRDVMRGSPASLVEAK